MPSSSQPQQSLKGLPQRENCGSGWHPKGYAMKEAELKVNLAVMGDEVIGTIQMTGPLYCHVEFAAALIREISKDSGVPVHQVLADIGRVL